jgi:hypothetical protein
MNRQNQINDSLVEHGGFLLELSDSCDLWLSWCQHAIEGGNLEAWKLIRG